MHNHVDALHAVVDVHEAAGAGAVAPDFDLVIAAELGFDHFAADSGRGLLAASIPGTVGAVDVMEPRDASLQAEVLAEMSAHAFAEEFFPTVAIFRHSWIGVFFFEARI